MQTAGQILDTFFVDFGLAMDAVGAKGAYSESMRILTATKILFGSVLTFGLIQPTLVYANVAQGASNSFVSPILAKSWNKLAYSWPRLIKDNDKLKQELNKIGVGYNPRFEKQDEDFIIQTSIQQANLPNMKVVGDAYEFTDKAHPEFKLTIKDLGNKKLLLNGKEFTYNEKISLEDNLANVKSLLSSKEKVSFLNSLFFPTAHAELSLGWMIGIGVAILAVGLFIGYKWGKKIKNAVANQWENDKQHLPFVNGNNNGCNGNQACQNWRYQAQHGGNGNNGLPTTLETPVPVQGPVEGTLVNPVQTVQ